METKSSKAKGKKAPEPKTTEPARAYKVVVGLNYPTASGEKRAEAGDVVSDLPARSIPWLLSEGYISDEKGA